MPTKRSDMADTGARWLRFCLDEWLKPGYLRSVIRDRHGVKAMLKAIEVFPVVSPVCMLLLG